VGIDQHRLTPLPAIWRSKIDCEAIREQGHVVVILFVGIVAKVMESLHGRRQASDGNAVDVTEPGEVLCRIGDPRAIRQLLRCRIRGVKVDGVKVDAAVRSVSDYEPGGQFVEGDGDAEGGKSITSDFGVGKRDNAVEIIVFSGLLSDQGVDAPATVQSDTDPSMFQGCDDVQHTPRIHHFASNPRTIAVGSKLT
jgi:hypothetical protein